MKHKYQGGLTHRPTTEGFIEGLIIALGLAAILLLFILPKNIPGPTQSIPNLINGGTNNPVQAPAVSQNATTQNNMPKNSAFANSVSINSGNAQYSYQPFDEYISLSNSGSKSINISGWTLQNAKGSRAYSLGGSLVHYSSDTVAIPQGTYILSPTGTNTLENIVLKPNESAIITTGSMGMSIPYKIISFKENECTGYLQSLPDYYFNPSLNQNCVVPRNEPGVANLDTSCQDYIANMSSCHTPKFNTVDAQGHTTDSQGNTCTGCVDGNNTLSNTCVAFIKSHFSYPGCLVYHQNDPNFSGSDWRIYLGQQWELWAKSYETISLLDSSGKLVNYISY